MPKGSQKEGETGASQPSPFPVRFLLMKKIGKDNVLQMHTLHSQQELSAMLQRGVLKDDKTNKPVSDVRDIDPARWYRFEDTTAELYETFQMLSAGLDKDATESVAFDPAVREGFPDLQLVSGGERVEIRDGGETLLDLGGVLVSRSTSTVLHVAARLQPALRDIRDAQIDSVLLQAVLRGELPADEDSVPAELAGWGENTPSVAVRTFLAGMSYPRTVHDAALRRGVVPVLPMGRICVVLTEDGKPARGLPNFWRASMAAGAAAAMLPAGRSGSSGPSAAAAGSPPGSFRRAFSTVARGGRRPAAVGVRALGLLRR